MRLICERPHRERERRRNGQDVGLIQAAVPYEMLKRVSRGIVIRTSNPSLVLPTGCEQTRQLVQSLLCRNGCKLTEIVKDTIFLSQMQRKYSKYSLDKLFVSMNKNNRSEHTIPSNVYGYHLKY